MEFTGRVLNPLRMFRLRWSHLDASPQSFSWLLEHFPSRAGEPAVGEECKEEGEAGLPACQKSKIWQLLLGNLPLAEPAERQQLRSKRAHTGGDAFCAGRQ